MSTRRKRRCPDRSWQSGRAPGLLARTVGLVCHLCLLLHYSDDEEDVDIEERRELMRQRARRRMEDEVCVLLQTFTVMVINRDCPLHQELLDIADEDEDQVGSASEEEVGVCMIM